MGKKADLPAWDGWQKLDAGRTILDSDLEAVVEKFDMVHEMWRDKEATRFEDHRANVDATPFGEDDLRVVEYAFRLTVAKADLVRAERKTLHDAWKVAKKFHWRHNLDIEKMLDEDEARDEARGVVPDLPLGERIYNCECDVLAGKIRKKDKRLKRLGRIAGFIRHALYIRGQYRTGIDIAEWSGPQIRQMALDYSRGECECEACVKDAQDRIKKSDGERGAAKKFIRSLTVPFSVTAQEKEAAQERKKEGGLGAGFTINGQRALVFGSAEGVGFLFGKK